MNSTERLEAIVEQPKPDSLVVDMPYFPSAFHFTIKDNKHLEGLLNLAPTKDPIRVTAEFVSSEPDLPKNSSSDYEKYSINFSPGEDCCEYPAIGLFQHTDNYAYGTFMTETGDYRFLDGLWQNDKMTLTCFDGAHLFRFDCEVVGDSLTKGVFYSGSTWSEPWSGIKDASATLRDPYKVTYLLPNEDDVVIDVHNENLDIVTLDHSIYEGKVTILQVFGSWCPNCLDENLYYKTLHTKYADQGLQILPVAFERTENAADGIKAARKHLDAVGINYPVYYGGELNKKTTSEEFPTLNAIISYPTSIYIGKDGKVKHIHTGFSGPSTGDYYTQYTQKTESLIEQMLAQ